MYLSVLAGVLWFIRGVRSTGGGASNRGCGLLLHIIGWHDQTQSVSGKCPQKKCLYSVCGLKPETLGI